MSGGLLAQVRRRDQRLPPLAAARAVLAHLGELLNARHGDSALDARYGLPDLTDLRHGAPEGVETLQRTISEVIRLHEPRLTSIRVSAGHGAGHAGPGLRFEVRAELAGGEPLHFTTDVDPGGRVRVS